MLDAVRRNGTGAAALAATAFLWSLAGLFIKLVDWNPFAIACGRSVVAAVFLLAWIRKPRFTFSGAQVGAALANAATMLMFIYANKTTTSANAILLQYGAPVYTGLLGAVMLREKPRLEHWLGFAGVAAGMAVFFAGNLGGGSLVGDIVAIASGVSFAFYFVFMRMQKDGSPLESNLLSHLLTAAVAFVACLFMPAPRLDARSLAVIAALGVFQIGCAAILFSWGIKRVPAIEAILIAGLEPVFNPLWVFLAMGEKPSPAALVGGGVIMAAVLASSTASALRERSAAVDRRE